MIVDPLTRDSPRLLFLRSTLEPFLVCTRFLCPNRTMNILVFFRDPLNSLCKRVTSRQHSVFEFCAGLSLDDHYVKGTRQKEEKRQFLTNFEFHIFFVCSCECSLCNTGNTVLVGIKTFRVSQ